MDWTALLTPVIVAVIPMLVALGKHYFPQRLKVLYPAAATVLGPVLDLVIAWLTSRSADPKYGVMMGLAAIGVRELWDQLRNIPVKA